MAEKHLIFTAMRAAMEGTTVEPPVTEEEMIALYKLAKRHDVAHLLAAALQGKMLQVDMTATLHRQYMTAIFRTEQLRAELPRRRRVTQLLPLALSGALVLMLI